MAIRFSLERNIVLINSPYCTNVGRHETPMVQDTVGVGVESSKIVSPRALPNHLFKDFCCRIYRLATIHFVTDRQTDGKTDRQTDRETYDNTTPTADHTAFSSTIG